MFRQIVIISVFIPQFNKDRNVMRSLLNNAFLSLVDNPDGLSCDFESSCDFFISKFTIEHYFKEKS